MESVEKIKERIEKLNPVACGNSRSCYHVDDRVVLVEKASISTYYQAQKAQEYSNLLHSKGVNTARIESLFFEDEQLYWVEDKLPGHPVYFRNEKSFCMSRGVEKPIEVTRARRTLKDDFYKENNIHIGSYIMLPLEQRREIDAQCEKYIEDRIQSDPELKTAFAYYQQVQNELVAQNQAFAESYLKADQTHFDKFLSDLMSVYSYHSGIDCHSDNFLYDEENGFSLIDLAIPAEIKQKEMEDIDFCRATGYMIDILTRGTKDPETQRGIVEKCFASAESLGIEVEGKDIYLPPQLKQTGYTYNPNQENSTSVTEDTAQ